MKLRYTLLIVACLSLLCGCTTVRTLSVENSGTYIDTAGVDRIKKGVTTADQVAAIFGEPYQKDILSANQIMWHYSYQSVTNTLITDTWNPYAIVTKQTAGFDVKLDILLQDDVVINFSCVKAPIQKQVQNQGTE